MMYDPAQMRAADVQRLRSFGIETKVSPSHDPRRVFTVCHQKFVVIDRKLVVIESANWANTSLPEREAGAARKKGNREWLVRIDDEPVANWYGDLFEADWNVPSLGEAFGVGVAPAPLAAAAFRAPRFAAPRDFPVTTFTGQQMTVTPLTSPDNYFDKVLPMIRSRAQSHLASAAIYRRRTVDRPFPGCSMLWRRGSEPVLMFVSSSARDSTKRWDATKETLQDAKLLDSLRAINLDNFTHCHNKGVIVDDCRRCLIHELE